MHGRNAALVAVGFALSACGLQYPANLPWLNPTKDANLGNGGSAAEQVEKSSLPFRSPDPGEVQDSGADDLKYSYNDLHFTNPAVQPNKFAVGEQFKISGESTQPEVEVFVYSTRPGADVPSNWVNIGTAPVVNGKWEFKATLAATYRGGSQEIQIGAPVDSWQWGFRVKAGEFTGVTGQSLSVFLPCGECAWEKFDNTGERPPLTSY